MTDTNRESTFHNLSKAVATTASAMVQSNLSGNSDVLLNNSNYQKAMFEALNKSKQVTMTKRHYDSKKSPSEVLKTSFNTDAKIFRAMTKLSDDLLNDMPQQESQFSLFQGFNAVLPEIEEQIETNSAYGQKKLLDSNLDTPLPRGITMEKIKTTQSTKQLNKFKDDINYKLDLFEIRKGLSANEIQEIDKKIQKLQATREIVFERVRKFEQDEIFLENQLMEIESRLELVKDVDDETTESDDNDTVIVHSINSDEDEPENKHDLLLSQSIYGKLEQNPPQRKVSTRKTSNRKTKPTLQKYYEPGSEIKTFQAHEDAITCLDFDIPFGTLVSASLDNTVRVWDLSRTKCTGLLEGHVAAVKCLQMEENLVVTGSLDASLKLWDLSRLDNYSDDTDSPLLHTFESHVNEITALNFHNQTLVSGSSDRTIRQWDLASGHCVQTLDVLWASAQNNDNLTPAVNSWSAKPTSFIGALQVYDAALASGTADGMVRLWDLRSGDVIRSLVGHTNAVTCLQFDDKYLITGSLDRSVRIWDLRTGSIFDAFAYDSPINSLQFDSRRIVCTNNENTVKIYDRIDEKHWSCGAGESDSSASISEFVRYKEGYLAEGRLDGKIGSWAI